MGPAARSLVPVAAGGILTAGVTLGLRAFLRPDPGTLSATLYRFAPLIGSVAGLVGAGAMYMVAGPSAGLAAGLTSVIGGGALFGAEALNAAKPGGLLAVSGPTAALPAGDGTAGLRALLPQYGTEGLGAIVMSPVGDTYGDSVNVAGLGAGYRPNAFGKNAF